MKISDVMTSNVEFVSPYMSLKEAAEKMRSSDIGALPVCENGHVIGMVTDRDITSIAVAEGADSNTTTVEEVMTSEKVFCFQNQSVEDAAKLMEEHQVRRLLVLGQGGQLAGIVSLADLAKKFPNGKMTFEVLKKVSEDGDTRTDQQAKIAILRFKQFRMRRQLPGSRS